jgi:hypothetical protein
MTPKFLRAEAARFREMAESITDREASRQRLLGMAADYESRANAADEVQPTEPQMPDAEPESAPPRTAPPQTTPDEAVAFKAARVTPAERRLRSARTLTLPPASDVPGK